MNLLTTSSRVFGVGVGHRRLGARRDELADVDPDERLLGEVEVAVDVPERGQVEDDRVHLLLGDVGIRAEREHRTELAPSARATPCWDMIISCAGGYLLWSRSARHRHRRRRSPSSGVPFWSEQAAQRPCARRLGGPRAASADGPPARRPAHVAPARVALGLGRRRGRALADDHLDRLRLHVAPAIVLRACARLPRIRRSCRGSRWRWCARTCSPAAAAHRRRRTRRT